MDNNSLQNFTDFYHYIEEKRVYKSFICTIQNIEKLEIKKDFYQLAILCGKQINKQFFYRIKYFRKYNRFI